MAKLTLNDITGGYQTATAYNANNALVEAALENTLSLDGTTPNQMGAALDMNSNDVNNVDALSAVGTITTTGTMVATSLILDGTVVTVIEDAATVAAAPDATQVSFTPSGGSLTTLQDALDDDYIRNDENATLTGNLAITGTVDGVDIATRDANLATAEASIATLVSDPPTADWYTEGTFEVALTTLGGSITIDPDLDTLAYTKVGNLVTVTGKITVLSVSSPSSVITMSGLPFALDTSLAGESSEIWSAMMVDNLSGPADVWLAYVSGTEASFAGSNGSVTLLTSVAPLTQAGTTFGFNFHYFTAD